MSDSGDISKLILFLSEQFTKRDHQQCVKVELFYVPRGLREDRLCGWERAEKPELFEKLDQIEALSREISERAEGYSDGLGTACSFMVRTYQALGKKAAFAFKVLPSIGAGIETPQSLALPPPNGEHASTPIIEAMQVITQNNRSLIQSNQQMHQGTIGQVMSIAQGLQKENHELHLENRQLRIKLDEATSLKDQREYQMAIDIEAAKNKQRSLDQIMSIGKVALANIAGAKDAAESPLALLLKDLAATLRPEQMMAIANVLDDNQKIMFAGVLKLVKPPDQKAS